jgi:hypothetical protein
MIARTLTTILLATIALAPVQAGVLGSFGSRHGKDCMPRHAIRTETAESETSLIFHANGGRAYRNTLPAPCDGLTKINDFADLGWNAKDPDLLCAGDLVWLKNNKIFSASDEDSAGCKLGTFEAIGEMALTENLRR